MKMLHSSNAQLAEEKDDSDNAKTCQLTVKNSSFGKGPPPDPPTTCCMTGCANCVWIEHAEKLKEYYSDGGSKAREEIMKIEDPNMRAFLLLEIS